MIDNKKNSVWLSIQFIVSILFSLITLKLNLLQFGKDTFGIWILLISFWGVSNIIDLGFGTALVKYIASVKAKDENTEITEISSTGFYFFVSFGVLLLVFGYFIGSMIYFSNEKVIPSDSTNIYLLVFIIMGGSFYLQYLTSFFRSLFEGMNNFILTSKLSLLYNILILISVLIIYFLKLGIQFLALAYLLSSFIIIVSYYFIIIQRLGGTVFNYKNFRIAWFKKMLNFSFTLQVSTILGASIDPIIKYVIGNFSSAGVITYYEIARRFAIAISGLFNTAFKTILPQTSILKNREEYLVFLFGDSVKFSRFSITYSSVCYGICSIFIVVVMQIWFGFPQSIIIFFILSLAESVNNLGYMIYTFFIGTGKGIYLIMIQTFNVLLIILSLVLGFLIFKNYLGLFGYYISVLITNVLMLYLLKIQTGLSIHKYLANIELNKLIILHLFIVVIIITSSIFNTNLYILSSILTLLSILFFQKDIRFYFFQFVSLAKQFKER
jgi:O-antigen/teichoic acid export membrane protein